MFTSVLLLLTICYFVNCFVDDTSAAKKDSKLINSLM